MHYRIMFLILVVFTLFFSCSRDKKTDLVVYVVVDQMRADYLDNFSPYFTENGFKRLMAWDVWFSNCFHDHSCTYTSSGHTTLGTGVYAYKHGIMSNYMYERSNDKYRYCVEDTSSGLVASDTVYAKKGLTNFRTLVTSFGTNFKRHFTQGRVFGISLKDRGAILTTGQGADGAFWYNTSLGQFVTSTPYMKTLPQWLIHFNDSLKADYATGYRNPWNRLLDEELYNKTVGEDNAPGEEDWKSMGVSFPHPVLEPDGTTGEDFYSKIRSTPVGDEILWRAAKELIKNEKLGQGNEPDFLVISYSAMDYIGHSFGPNSHEMMDEVIRMDRIIEKMFTYFDKNFGIDNYILVLTADHGVASFPEYITENGGKAARLPKEKILETVHSAIGKVIKGKFAEKYWIKTLGSSYIFFTDNFLNLPQDIQQKAIKEIKIQLKNIDGIRDAFWRSEIESFDDTDKTRRRIKHGFYAERSGDLYILVEPDYQFGYSSANVGTTHGTPYDYDAHVPLFFHSTMMGAKIVSDTVGTADIVFTLADLLKMELDGNRDGRSLLSY